MHPIIFWILAPIVWFIGWAFFCVILPGLMNLDSEWSLPIGLIYGFLSAFPLFWAYDEWVN